MNVEALKVGDKVLIGVAVGDWVRKTSYKIPKPIERFTATQIIVDGRRFRKETLTEVGNSWAKLELDLSKSQLEEYNLHCKKLKMLHRLPYFDNIGRVTIDSPFELIEKGFNLLVQLESVYKEAQEFRKK